MTAEGKETDISRSQGNLEEDRAIEKPVLMAYMLYQLCNSISTTDWAKIFN